ncbi:hybrid signal transduction histidine kinase M-like [Maniola jurtina]|uniref:hybrid signal transduction histidine kinase M-like n=1 Tax=Maniola jurtina TaxID=191418 RepID=UPI001E68C49E|nr:hybrid signal transduction histidine kinase M-like [Maniola jurtina]XP_045774922.1 hybrid signal transduction histidine kinase M-like [Maniola jurtina]XP_045774923.1 hybrid signal transduction histidine kinase M-like [Maniola jurtina]XP_045774924.1 hybrid signal transduction histidine kinase M-like [Maniola jurtina]
MGKRNKGEQKDNNVKTKKKRSNNNIAANDDTTEEISRIETTGNGKNKKIVFDNDEPTKIAPVKKITNALSTTSPNKSRNKNTRSTENNIENNKTKQNKKIIFTDDNEEGTEVTINKGGKMKTDDEEEPADEEIDKFCDELDEEDNVQYDNWVKLIEAKLGPNKKK